jgi:hypothetical protein
MESQQRLAAAHEFKREIINEIGDALVNHTSDTHKVIYELFHYLGNSPIHTEQKFKPYSYEKKAGLIQEAVSHHLNIIADDMKDIIIERGSLSRLSSDKLERIQDMMIRVIFIENLIGAAGIGPLYRRQVRSDMDVKRDVGLMDLPTHYDPNDEHLDIILEKEPEPGKMDNSDNSPHATITKNMLKLREVVKNVAGVETRKEINEIFSNRAKSGRSF